ncbi:MAG: DUF5683 domain-containing protein [Balneolales bacterium]|nr:DUF5683 domain-containing protein [Balneolales bacterium]
MKFMLIKRIQVVALIACCAVIFQTQTSSAQFVFDETLSEDLGPFGYLQVHHPASTVYLKAGNLIWTLTSGETLRVPYGSFQFRVFAEDYEDVLYNVIIVEDQVTRINALPNRISTAAKREKYSVFPVVFWNANLIVETDSDSKIRIKGSLVGEDGVGGLLLDEGWYEIETIRPDGRTKSARYRMDPNRLTYVQAYHRPKRETILSSSFVPGLAQYHHNEPLKTLIYAPIVTGSLVYAVRSYLDHRNSLDRYNTTMDQYNRQINEGGALELGLRMAALEKEVNDAARVRNISIGVFSALYAANIIDALWPRKYGYRTESRKIHPFTNLDPVNGTFEGGVLVRFN